MRSIIFGVFSSFVLCAAMAAQATQAPAMVMGFDQDATTHHFYLYPDGGAIDVSANDPKDKTNLDAVRSHLPHIAKMFGDGDFSAPMMVHATNVPGTTDLARLKDKVKFRYEDTPRGGRVDIKTTNADALKALYAFLRFQIADHKTGDPTDVRKR